MTTIETIDDARAHLRALAERASVTLAAGHRHPISEQDVEALRMILDADTIVSIVERLRADPTVELTPDEATRILEAATSTMRLNGLVPLNMHDDRTIEQKVAAKDASVAELPQVAALIAEMKTAGWEVIDDAPGDGWIALGYTRYNATESFDLRATIYGDGRCTFRDSRDEGSKLGTRSYDTVKRLRAALDRRSMLVPADADYARI